MAMSDLKKADHDQSGAGPECVNNIKTRSLKIQWAFEYSAANSNSDIGRLIQTTSGNSDTVGDPLTNRSGRAA